MIKPKQPLTSTDFQQAFPNSRKIHVPGSRDIRVPMREIALSGGEPPLRVYDTSGPQGYDPREGLPALRRGWILERGDVEERSGARAGMPVLAAKPGRRPTQLHYASAEPL